MLFILYWKSTTLQHVMAESPENLKNTRLAALHLSKGALRQLEVYVNAAKKILEK